MKLSRQVVTSGPVDMRLAYVTTPLKFSVWEQQLCGHPDKDFAAYILKGIRQGFRIGVDPTANPSSATKNMRSAVVNPQVIDEYIKQESKAGNIIGPFSKAQAPAVHINRFGKMEIDH